MNTNRDRKFNNIISILKKTPGTGHLHPLVKAQVRQRILTVIQQSTPTENFYLFGWKKPVWRLVIPTSIALLLCAGTVFASAGSNPGDTLYPVKKARENIELNLASTPKAKAKIQAEHAKTRLVELAKIKTQFGKTQIKQKTEANAKSEVKNAISNLAAVKIQLLADDDEKDAIDLDNNIAALQQEARMQDLFIEVQR